MTDAIELAMPEYAETEIPGWSESTRDVSDVRVVLVRLTPPVEEMTHSDFCEAITDSDEQSVFRELVEVYDVEGGGDPVYRVTGEVVDGAPRYFRDSVSATIFLQGRFSRDNTGIALYGENTFDEAVYPRIDPYRVFSVDDKENRVAEIRDVNAFIDKISSDQFQQHLEELIDASDEEVDGFLTDHTNTDPE